MSSAELHLYRVKFIKPAQAKLFNPNTSPRDFFEEALKVRPSAGVRQNHVWHIGNVEYFDNDGGRFAIGRTTKTTIEKYDDQTGDFVEQMDDSGPYTYVYFDASLGLLGIAKKSKVAPKVASIARKLQLLFGKTELAWHSGIEVRVNIIPDPDDFLKKIHSAYSIKRFRAEFTGPNPVDADALFQKPLSFYCQELNAKSGEVTVSGDDLNDEAIAAVAKSTAATGNHASALIQPSRGSRLVSVAFKGNAIKVLVDAEEHKDLVLQAVRGQYSGVRE
jgi:hypothetical protein